MARGWESKSVESQMDAADSARTAEQRSRPKTPEQIERDTRRQSLMLSRTRVLNDLQHACNSRYRAQLEQGLAFLDLQIAEIERQERS